MGFIKKEEKMSETYKSKCPECGEAIELDSYDDVGDEVECYACGSVLIIKQLDPPRVSTIKRVSDDDSEDFSDIEDIDELKGLRGNDFED
jgi:lysine biosynthesis protein LysW